MRYSAECVTFCVYAAGFNSCNKKHTRKIANRCHKQTRMDISYNQCRAPLTFSPHSTAIEVDCMEYA